MLRSWISLLLAAVLLGAFASGSVGCASSGKPKSLADEFEAEANPPLSDTNKELARGCLSAVEIHGQRLVTVQETVESVFTAAGLAVFKRNAEEIGFERLATRGERGGYGTWFGEDVRVRLRVEIQQQSGGVYFLRCRSFIARDAGSNAEDQQPLARRHVKKYEPLLDEVAARLN